MPKSWFNPTAKSGSSFTYKDIWPMYSDLVHVIPAEGIVNNKRSNNPYGTNNGEWYSSEEGFSKMGACTYSEDYTGRCFEPNDEYKGDLARIYFYMVTAYEKKQPTWSSTGNGVGDHCGTWTGAMFNLDDDDPYQPFAPWAFEMLMEWSKKDPVSQKEIDRNEAVWQMQGNRNPFVDYPGLEDYIWGDKTEVFSYGGEPAEEEPTSANCDLALNKATFGVDWQDNVRDYYERRPVEIEKDGVTIAFSYGICGRYLYASDEGIRLYNYNTLSLKAHQKKITKVEFTVSHQDEGKNLKAFVGTMDGNTWTGNEDEVLFTTEYVASKYFPSTKTSIHYYAELTNMKVTVADPSGIDLIQTPVVRDNHVYNLMGVRVDERQLTPGIYVKNGRKFLVK
jgi:endonuclease I